MPVQPLQPQGASFDSVSQSLDSLEKYADDPKRTILVVRKNQEGTSYLEAVEDNFWTHPIDWISYRLKWIFPFLSYTNAYKLSTIHEYLSKEVTAKPLAPYLALVNKQKLRAIKLIDKKFADHRFSRVFLKVLGKHAREKKVKRKIEQPVEIRRTPRSSVKSDPSPRLISKTTLHDVEKFCAAGNHAIDGRGVENGKNRCYFNSTIKALRASPLFQKNLSEKIQQGEKAFSSEAQFEFAKLLKALCDCLSKKSNEPLEQRGCKFPEELSPIDSVALKLNKADTSRPKFPIEGRDQQDAQEICDKILDLIYGEADLFRLTQMQSHIFQDIDVPIPSLDKSSIESHRFLTAEIPAIKNGIQSLQDVFDGFLQNEEIDLSSVRIADDKIETFQEFITEVFSQEELDSKKIQINTVSTKQIVGKAPDFLPIHIRRFTESGDKNTTPLKIPFVLNVRVQSDTDAATLIEEYVLRSVVVHSGPSIRSGHYYTYIPDPTTAEIHTIAGKSVCRKWYVHNDQSVSSASYEDIQSDVEKNGYLAFYEKVPHT